MKRVLNLVIALWLVFMLTACGSGTTSSVDDQASQEGKVETNTEENVLSENEAALEKAEIYSDTMYMSKQGIYDQLTSEAGDKFSAEAAQYAVDNLDANWSENALKKAKNYQEKMNMSSNEIYGELMYGDQFTSEEVAYAIGNLE